MRSNQELIPAFHCGISARTSGRPKEPSTWNQVRVTARKEVQMHWITCGLFRMLTLALLAQFAHSQSGTTTAAPDPAELQARQQSAIEMVHAMQPPEQFEERIRSFMGPVLAQITAEEVKRGHKTPADYAQRLQRVLTEAMPYEELV